MNNKAKKQLVGMYDDVISELIKVKKANRILAVAIVAVAICARFSDKMLKEKEKHMKRFNDKLDMIYMNEGDTACDD